MANMQGTRYTALQSYGTPGRTSGLFYRPPAVLKNFILIVARVLTLQLFTTRLCSFVLVAEREADIPLEV